MWMPKSDVIFTQRLSQGLCSFSESDWTPFSDMTNYPNDKHVCSFIMIAKGQTNVEFYAGRRALANKDLSVNLSEPPLSSHP